jgi:hypothetical protein
MLGATSERLGRMHRAQVQRDPWPDFAAFDASAFAPKVRRAAAVQWAGRASAEHGSVHQFSILTHALCNLRVELSLLGGLARLITDEVRHAELCAEMAVACYPEGRQAEPAIFDWAPPRAPWADPPPLGDDPMPLRTWAAEAILVACCIGETLSRPMLEAIAVVATEPTAVAVARQILRDEHLHAAFGWESLQHLLDGLDAPARARLVARMTRAFGGVEATTAGGIAIEQVAGRQLQIEASAAPNLGTLTGEQYAMIFFATMESEVLPKLEAIGLPAFEAWRARPRGT